MCSHPGSTIQRKVTSSSRGFAPGTRRLLIAREVEDRGRFHRSFEELRLDDLALVRQAGSARSCSRLRPMAGRHLAT